MISHQKKLSALTAVILCMTAAVSCSAPPVTTRQLMTDFTTEGFIDRDHFQIIVVGFPDKKTKGIVEARESARKNAEDKLESAVVKKLSDYAAQSFFKRKNIDAAKITNLTAAMDSCNKKMRSYLQYSAIAFEYYNEDRSAVLVIRIYKKNLIDELESLTIPVILQGENHAQ